jgi:hypothetical protein
MKITWNAHVHMDGANAKWVGLGWGIPDDHHGDPMDYEALITVMAPDEANATIGKVGRNEIVALRSSAELPCGPDGITVEVTYRVSANDGAEGSEVEFNIAENAGQKGTPTGAVLAHGTGLIGDDIIVRLVIPGTCT